MVVLKIHGSPDTAPKVVRVEHFPATIGRSAINAIVIPHPTISEEHARLELRDGVLYVVDLNSRNGLRREGELRPEWRLDEGGIVVLGSVKLEILLPAQLSVLPAIAHELSRGGNGDALRRALRTGAFHLLGFGAVVGTYFVCQALHGLDAEWDDTVSRAFLTSLGVYVIASLVSLFSKLHSGGYRFQRLLNVLNLAACVLILFVEGSGHLLFNLGGARVGMWVEALCNLLILFGFGAWVATIIFHEVPRWRVRLFSALVTLGLFAVAVVLSILGNAATQGYAFAGLIGYPLRDDVAGTVTMDSFLRRFDESAESLSSHRTKKLKELSEP